MPETLRIGAHSWTVLRTPGKQLLVNGDECLGSCNIDTNTIRIAKGLRFTKAQEILCHELLHACTSPTLIHFKRVNEEIFVDTLAPPWVQLMQDNPALITYLTYKEE